MKNKVIEETDEFYYLENKLVIPKQKFIVKVNKVILDRSGRIDPHSLINAGNLDFTVEKLLLHQYTRDMRRNAVYISRELMFNIAGSHSFAQGNKRTALIIGLMMLIINVNRHYITSANASDINDAVLTSYDQMMDAHLMEAIAAWQEKERIPELKETIEDRMIKEGILKVGKEASDNQIKEYLSLVLSKHIQIIEDLK